MPNTAIPLYQTGTISPRDLARFDSNGLTQSAGGLDGDVFGKGVNPFSITDNAGPGLAVHSAATSGQYNTFGIGHDSSGNALLTLDSFGGMADKTLYFRKNGTLYEFPFNIGGGITGPVSTVADNVAVWNNTNGTVLKDGGFPPIQGPATTVVGDLATWNNTTGTRLKTARNGLGSNQLGVQVDSQAGFAAWGSPVLHIGKTGADNAFVSSTENSAAPGTFAFPVGLAGYGKVKAGSNGNMVFGVYGLGELFANTGTVIGAEFTVRNFTGLAPDTNIPPSTSIPNLGRTLNGVHITAGALGTGDCSTGLTISNETGLYSDRCFTNGAYINLYRQYGLFIESMPSGSQTGLVVKTNGNGTGVQIQSTAEPSPANAIFGVINSASANLFRVTYGGNIVLPGDILMAGGLVSGSVTLMTTSVSLSNAAAGATATLTNAPLAGNPTKWIAINDNGVTRHIPTW